MVECHRKLLSVPSVELAFLGHAALQFSGLHNGREVIERMYEWRNCGYITESKPLTVV